MDTFDVNASNVDEILRSLPESQRPYFQAVLNNLFEENHRLQREVAKLKQEVDIDPTTNLYNRRRFDNDLLEKVSEAERAKENTRNEPQTGLLLILCDVDLFKAVNDKHGHQYGDTVLKRVADTLKSTMRRHERSYRLGGDEFAIIVPRMTERTDYTLAERVRIRVKEDTSDETIPPGVTMSFGVAAYQRTELISKDIETLSQRVKTFFNQADAALYQAKEGGRNQIMVCNSVSYDRQT